MVRLRYRGVSPPTLCSRSDDNIPRDEAARTGARGPYGFVLRPDGDPEMLNLAGSAAPGILVRPLRWPRTHLKLATAPSLCRAVDTFRHHWAPLVLWLSSVFAKDYYVAHGPTPNFRALARIVLLMRPRCSSVMELLRPIRFARRAKLPGYSYCGGVRNAEPPPHPGALLKLKRYIP